MVRGEVYFVASIYDRVAQHSYKRVCRKLLEITIATTHFLPQCSDP